MKLNDLTPPKGSTHAKRRVGRGIAGKGGKTAGRGTKGQKARTQIPAGFEGGQQPILGALAEAARVHEPVPRVVHAGEPRRPRGARGRRRDRRRPRRARPRAQGRPRQGPRSRGPIDRAVRVSAHGFSKSAEAAIEAAGGSTESWSRCRSATADRPLAATSTRTGRPRCLRASRTSSASLTFATRSASRSRSSRCTSWAATCPVPGVSYAQIQILQARAGASNAPRLPEPVQRRRARSASRSSGWASCPTSRARSSSSCSRRSSRSSPSGATRERSARRRSPRRPGT